MATSIRKPVYELMKKRFEELLLSNARLAEYTGYKEETAGTTRIVTIFLYEHALLWGRFGRLLDSRVRETLDADGIYTRKYNAVFLRGLKDILEKIDAQTLVDLIP